MEAQKTTDSQENLKHETWCQTCYICVGLGFRLYCWANGEKDSVVLAQKQTRLLVQ